MKTAISSTKKTKQQRKYLIYIQKLLKINISFITSNDFRRLCPFVFVMLTSKHKYQYFPLILVQSFSAGTFSGIYALIVSDTNFQFGHTFSF